MKGIETWLGSDRATKVLAVVTFVVVAGMFILAGLTIPGIATDTGASRRTDDLASCRAAFAAEADRERDRVLETHGAVLSDVGQAVVHAIRQDPVALDGIAERLVEHEAAREEATADLVAATDAYAEAVLLSQEDPKRFLDECKAIQ